MSNTSKTDWSRIDMMKDEDIDTSDIPPLSEDFWVNAQLRLPKDIVTVKVEIDPETFAWFQSQGETAQEQMSVALKIYAQANKAFCSSIAFPVRKRYIVDGEKLNQQRFDCATQV